MLKLWDIVKIVFLVAVAVALFYAYAYGASVETTQEVEITPDTIPCDLIVKGHQNWLKLREMGCVEAKSQVAPHQDKPMVLVITTTCLKFREGSPYATPSQR